MTDTHKVNRPAPLKNVASFSTLLQRMVERDPDLPGLGCFYGPSGLGKSRSAIYGASRYRAAYIECGQFTNARSLMASILTELGEQKPRGTIEDMKNRAVMMMAANPRKPLIVDEVHFIANKRYVDVLREISDKSGAPVILIGEEMLPAHLEAFERVHNRVLEWLAAQPCDAEDLALLVAARCGGIEIKSDLAAAILADTEGNARRIVTNLAKAVEIAKISGVNSVNLEAFGGRAAIFRRHQHTPRKLR